MTVISRQRPGPADPFRRHAVVLLTVFALAACSGSEPEPAPPPPPPPEPTRVVAQVAAAATANPDPDGRPSPILVRVYELTSDSKFNAVSYFDLYGNETAVLGGDMRASEEIPLRPGQEIPLDMTFQDGSRFLGVAAAFQRIDNSVWRAAAEIPNNETTRLAIRIDGTTLTITPLPPEAK